jgi:hypothetical protein
VKEAEETDYGKTAFRKGLGLFLESKGFFVFALLVFPPLALLSGCAYDYNSNTSVSGDFGSLNAGPAPVLLVLPTSPSVARLTSCIDDNGNSPVIKSLPNRHYTLAG